MNDTTATDSTGPLLLTQDELGVMTVKNVWDHCLESGTFHTLLTATIRQLAASHGVVWIDYAQVENILVGGEDQLFLDVL